MTSSLSQSVSTKSFAQMYACSKVFDLRCSEGAKKSLEILALFPHSWCWLSWRIFLFFFFKAFDSIHWISSVCCLFTSFWIHQNHRWWLISRSSSAHFLAYRSGWINHDLYLNHIVFFFPNLLDIFVDEESKNKKNSTGISRALTYTARFNFCDKLQRGVADFSRFLSCAATAPSLTMSWRCCGACQSHSDKALAMSRFNSILDHKWKKSKRLFSSEMVDFFIWIAIYHGIYLS